MYRSSKSRKKLFDLFYLVTWDDFDLYYGHKAQEMILTNVSDNIHADSLALFALNIEILLADVAKPEMSNILTLTRPVTSLLTPRSWKFVFPRQFVSRAFECRLNFQNRSSSFGDQRGARNSPPPQWGAL